METVFEATMVLCGIYTLLLNLVWIHYFQCSDCKLWRNWVPCSIGVLWCGSGFVCKWPVRTAHGQKWTSGCGDPLNCIGTGYFFFLWLYAKCLHLGFWVLCAVQKVWKRSILHLQNVSCVHTVLVSHASPCCLWRAWITWVSSHDYPPYQIITPRHMSLRFTPVRFTSLLNISGD